MKPMHIFKLCDKLRDRPMRTFALDGIRSLKNLSIFIGGYELGTNFQKIGQADMRNFTNWVAEQLGFGSNSTSGWCNMIASKSQSDEAAFELFFELLDKYRSENNWKIAS